MERVTEEERSRPLCLIVDDDPFVVSMMTAMMGRIGTFDVRGFVDPAAAFGEVRDGTDPPDVIILDINMPGMDGMAFFRGLSNIGYRGGLILSSGESDALLRAGEQLATSYGLQMLGSLSKPPSLERLRELLDAARADFEPSRRAPQRVTEAVELARAIDAAQFACMYQPKVDMRTGELVGVEALARWQHPDDGLLGPDAFIAQAERHGLIHRLTRRIFALALEQQARWARQGVALRMAVNASVYDIGDLAFPDYVSDLTRQHGVDPRALVIEVTESGLAQDPRILMEVMARLRMRGFHLAIDDFGNGYSTMLKLRDFSFDELKIDQAFVHGGATNERHAVIFRASVDIGRQLGMHVVAEGIEDQADWGFAAGHEVDVAQGFFVARPLAPDALLPWLAQWRERIADGEIVSRSR